MQSHLEVAIEAARTGGRVLMRHLGKVDRESVSEKGRNDWVTAVDRASEAEIRRFLHGRYPAHQFLGEESSAPGGHGATAQGYRWVVDPLDGTTNYMHSYPCFSVSVALEKDGVPIAGCVHDPFHDETYAAEKGAGATCNGKRIRVTKEADLKGALLVTGFPFRETRRIAEYFGALRELVYESQGMRRDGSAALDLCYVASGRFDGFWELGLSRWDLAAGSLILEEAGGIVTDFEGGPGALAIGDVVATNGKIHMALLKLLGKHFPEAAPGG